MLKHSWEKINNSWIYRHRSSFFIFSIFYSLSSTKKKKKQTFFCHVNGWRRRNAWCFMALFNYSSKRKLFPKWIRMIFFSVPFDMATNKKKPTNAKCEYGLWRVCVGEIPRCFCFFSSTVLTVVCASRNLINEITKLFILRKMKDDLSGESSTHRRPFGGEKSDFMGPSLRWNAKS